MGARVAHGHRHGDGAAGFHRHRHAGAQPVDAVELACNIAGTTAFRATSPLERCFRDTQTMKHHVFASEARYGTFGQVYLGVPPDFEVVAF